MLARHPGLSSGGVCIASRLFWVCLAILLLTLTPVNAQTPPGDSGEGQKLAREICAACHQIEKGDRGFSLSEAPSFQIVADDPAVTAISLRVFLRTPHETMPNIILTETETDDIISYILSLK